MTPPKSVTVPAADVVEVLAGVIRDQQQFFKEVLATVADISKHAISPPAPTHEWTQAEIDAEYGSFGMGVEDVDPADPMEVWLGPEFQREQAAVYDDASDAPFGLPGIKADAPAVVE